MNTQDIFQYFLYLCQSIYSQVEADDATGGNVAPDIRSYSHDNNDRPVLRQVSNFI